LTQFRGDETPEEPPPDPTRELASFEHPDKVMEACFSFDGEWIISACADKKARVIDIETGEVLRIINHGNFIHTVRIIEDGSTICTSCDDGFARVFDVRNEKLLVSFSLNSECNCAAFSPDGKRVVTAANATLLTGATQIFGLLIPERGEQAALDDM